MFCSICFIFSKIQKEVDRNAKITLKFKNIHVFSNYEKSQPFQSFKNFRKSSKTPKFGNKVASKTHKKSELVSKFIEFAPNKL